MEMIKYLTFFSAGRKFAIPFHDIRTVLVADKLQKIPEFPDYFAGSCLWNDTTVPVIDARARLGFESTEYTNRSLRPSRQLPRIPAYEDRMSA